VKIESAGIETRLKIVYAKILMKILGFGASTERVVTSSIRGLLSFESAIEMLL
jgi:hypothetical protein